MHIDEVHGRPKSLFCQLGPLLSMSFIKLLVYVCECSESLSTMDTSPSETLYSFCPVCKDQNCVSADCISINIHANSLVIRCSVCGTTYQVPGPPLLAGNTTGDTNYPGVSDNTVQQAQEAYTPPDCETNVGQTDNSDARLVQQGQLQYPPGDNLLSGPDLDDYMPLQQYLSDYIYEDALKCWLNYLAQICNTLLPTPSSTVRPVGSLAMSVASESRRANKAKFFCPYKDCRGYSRGFTAKHNFEGHMRAHHNERPHICVECGTAFTTKGDLSRHFKSLKHTTTQNSQSS